MAAPAVLLDGVRKDYAVGPLRVEALKGVSLEVARGEFLGVLGPSGSGKSTLLNILGLLDTPSGGSYVLDGVEVSRCGDDERSDLRNSRIGFVFQAYHLIPHLDALDNVALPLAYRGETEEPAKSRARELLARLGLDARAHHRPGALSGGERQRVALARALVGRPSLLLADEPTAALDASASEALLDLLLRLNREDGTTIVLMTHDPRAAATCSRRIALRDGRLVEDGG